MADEARHGGAYLRYMKKYLAQFGDTARAAFAKIGVLMASARRTERPLHPTNLHVSQELVEAYLRQHGIARREMLRSPHFLSIPLVIASTDLVVTVPLPVGEPFARIADVQVLEPPLPIPAFDLRQHWHRCQHDDPGNRWLRSVTRELFVESPGE